MEMRTFDWFILASIFGLQSHVYDNPILSFVASVCWVYCLIAGVALYFRNKSKKRAHV
jgi:hypothetical protein